MEQLFLRIHSKNFRDIELIANEKKIFVVDIDHVSLGFIKRMLGEVCQGYGESVYFSGGKVLAKYTYKQTFEPFLGYLSKNIKE